jgi:hypothetical protein
MSLPAHALIPSCDGFLPLDQLPLHAALGRDSRHYKHVVRVEAPQEPLQRTLLRNGLTIDSDASQRFLVAAARFSEPTWVAQRAIRPGDRLMVACERVDATLDPRAACMDRTYPQHDARPWQATAEMVEDKRLWFMLGYALGDGYFPHEQLSIDHFRLYAYDHRNTPLIDHFDGFCREHQLDAAVIEGTSPQLSVHHVPFQRWLRDLGFRSMAEGIRRVPVRLFRLPAWMREAVLQGFMSAWGEWTAHSEHGSPVLHVQINAPELRQGILRLFWSVGIAATIEQRGWKRTGNLVVQDIAAFQRRTNFILPYKRREIVRPPGRDGKWDTVTARTAQHLTKLLKATQGWRAIHADEREKILRCKTTGLRRKVAFDLFEQVGCTPPWWLYYQHCAVDDTRPVEGAVPLYDLSCTDVVSPGYLADFVLTRGSRIG